MRITVKEFNKGLCARCRSGAFIRSERGRTRFECERFNHVPPGIIEECTGFSDKNVMTEYQMKEVAWILTIDPKSKKIGFMSPGSENHKNAMKRVHFPTEDI